MDLIREGREKEGWKFFNRHSKGMFLKQENELLLKFYFGAM